MKSNRKKAAYASDGERVLHFVRHGEYVRDATQAEKLTPKGRRQARLLARAFRGLPSAKIRSSDVARAVETANILASELRTRVASRHRMLREMLPAGVPSMVVPSRKRADGRRRLEQIPRRFFRASRKVQHEIIVCHGNLIRALVLRITAGSPAGFHRLRIHHGSVTSFVVTKAGKVWLLHFNGITHVPASLRTYG